MRAGLYARVSTERQAERGTIGSQLALLRQHIAAAGDELVGEYVDDGHSGARLDRPGLDALRDAAEAGLIERVWCLSPDRLARAYAYQVLVLDELARFGVAVAFTDSPGLAADDPQATLLTQVQGVIAEYEKAKIAERYRRGKLFRARAGEIVTWKSPYGFRRIPRSGATGQAHHEIYEPEAAVVRRIFSDRAAGITVRDICRRLNADAIPSPTGKPTWGTSTLGRLLGNEAYIGRVYYNRTESVPDRRPTRHNRQVPRSRDEWIPIACPRIISDELFQAAGGVSTDNTKWSPTPRRTRRLAAQRPGQMRCLRGGHQLSQDARPQRHLAPLLPLPQPRPAARRRRIPPLPRTQHPRRCPRRVRVRPDPRRDDPPRPATGRRTSRRPRRPNSQR